MMISFVKHDEKQEEDKEWKSRYVALGNNIKHTDGRKVEEELRHWVPASLDSIRLGIAWSTLVPRGRVLRGDVPEAYLSAELTGPKTYLRLSYEELPMEFRTEAARGIPDLCFHLVKSIYGLPRGDSDWGALATSDSSRYATLEKTVCGLLRR